MQSATAPALTVAAPNGSLNPVLTWTDKSSNESGFKIERSLNGGAFSVIGTVAANTTTFTDPSAPGAGNFFYYRVYAYNSTSSSAYSNVVVWNGN
jgi:hypothetical protein